LGGIVARAQQSKTRGTADSAVLKKKRVRRAIAGATLAKISPPQLPNVYLRTRLFKLLDAACHKYPVVWIQAPPGAGKTTLIASYLKTRKLETFWYQVDAGDIDVASFFYYLGLAAMQAAPRRRRRPLPLLTPEYLPGLSTFTRNFFRELFSHSKRPGVLVLDNYQDVSAQALLQETLPRGLDEIPFGMNVVVVSRGEPPATFARLRASDKLVLLGSDELKLTEQESIGLAKLRHPKRRLPRTLLQSLHQRTQGWTAGMVLLLEHTQALPSLPTLSDVRSQTLFDYFASEIFRRTELSVQNFLMQTAFLPKIATPVAQSLTGMANAEHILHDLAQRSYFTIRHPGAHGDYEYHPLFREFLLNHAGARFTPEQLRDIQRRSAQQLVQSGDAEGAIGLLRLAQDWSALAAQALQQAPTMMSQGRHLTLKEWLVAIPEDVREANAWILYWLGICDMSLNQISARQALEQVFARAKTPRDHVLRALAWSAIVQSYIVEFSDLTPLGKWLDEYEAVRAGGEELPPPVQLDMDLSYMLGATFHQPQNPRLTELGQRLIKILPTIADPNQRVRHAASLIPYLTWIGGWSTAQHLFQESLEQAEAPLVRTLWCGWHALHLLDMGEVDACARLVDKGIAIAENTGVLAAGGLLLGTGALAALWRGDIGNARSFLERLRQQSRPTSHLHVGYALYVGGIIQLECGDIDGAVAQLVASFERAQDGSNMLGQFASRVAASVALGKRGDHEQAIQHVAASRDIADAIGSEHFVFLTNFSEANLHLSAGGTARTCELLARALAIASRSGAGPPPWCTRADVARLLALALEHDIEPACAIKMIRRLHLQVPEDFLPEAWPWPLKIYTLGRFSIVKDGKPIKFEGKAQRRPLDFLKALIAFGGRGVSEEKLSESLWPEADGDAAHQAFAITLHRLRRLLGSDTAVQLEGRQVTLNPTCVWVDVWGFERSLRQTEASPQQTAVLEKLLSQYGGAFLAADHAPWVLAPRERLRSKFLRAVAQHGASVEQRAEWQQALHWYQRAIEIDPLAEEFYRRLMQCFYQLGRRAEALAIYQRCQAILASTLSIDPARETTALYERIRAES
jgi:LuxR family transcriptional regulator, maltose regulon positive regulatory protein